MSWLCLGNRFRIRVMSQQRSFSTFLNCAAYVARTISGIRTQLLYLHVYCPSFQFSSLSAAFDKRQITCISYSNNNLTSIRIIGYCRETETYAMDAHPQWQQSRLIATGECRWGGARLRAAAELIVDHSRLERKLPRSHFSRPEEAQQRGGLEVSRRKTVAKAPPNTQFVQHRREKTAHPIKE